MIPIEDLLHRVQWDPGFAGAEVLVGYLDRVGHRIVRVRFDRIHLTRGDHFSFDAVEDDGSVHEVPLHRVREVWRDSVLIWQRGPVRL
jgi:uncharacterized protein (UPF0248 family)